VRPREKPTIDSLHEVICEKSIGTEMHDLNPFYRLFKVMTTIAPLSPLNISETVKDRGLVPKDHQH